MDLETDDAARFAALKRVYLWKPPAPVRAFELRQSWQHKGRIVLALADIENIAAAEVWRGAEVQIPVEERIAAPAGRYFVSDLVGCIVCQANETLGTIADVEEGPGGTLLHVKKPAGGEILIPFAEEYLRSTDFGSKRVEVALPEGLSDLNDSGK